MQKRKVIQWYTGEIARHQIRLIARCPWLELVGAFVYHEEKVGLDAGELSGIEALGVITTNKVEEILALDADVVLYNPPHERYDEIPAMLASGKNVISIMSGWNPKRDPAFADIEAACKKGNSSLFGTGLNPGLSYEMALLASSVCSDVDSIEIKTCEPQESLSEVFLTVFGFGKTEEELNSDQGGAFDIFKNLMSITELIAEKTHLPFDNSRLAWEFEPATQDYVDKMTIKKGTMGGLVIKAITELGDKTQVSIEVRFLLGSDYVSEAFLAQRPKQGWIEVDVKGTPGSRMTHEVYMEDDIIGTWATGTKAINSIPAVCEARAGLLAATDLPLGVIQKLV